MTRRNAQQTYCLSRLFFLLLFSVLLRFFLILSKNQTLLWKPWKTNRLFTIPINFLSIFGLFDRNIDQISCHHVSRTSAKLSQSFEVQKFCQNYNIHSAEMQDKLSYLLIPNLVYHIMVQAYKANLGLLVLSGAGFGHHLLFSGELTPKLYILHVVAVQRTTYVLCTTRVLH